MVFWMENQGSWCCGVQLFELGVDYGYEFVGCQFEVIIIQINQEVLGLVQFVD